jgi:hypothetical protein
MQKHQFYGCLSTYVENIAQRSRGGFHVCPICGSGNGPNKSGAFSIHGDGEHWKCFSCGLGGDLFDLIGRVEKISDFISQKKRAEELFGNTLSTGTRIKPGNFIHTEERDPEVRKELSLVDPKLMSASLSRYNRNNFYLWLCGVFGEDKAIELISMYHVGTSKYWSGACVFWQQDISGLIRGGKIMLYNPDTGRRERKPFPHVTWVHKAINIEPYRLQQCFFGEHLLADDSKTPVAIVESEKTAIVAAGFIPEYIWIASGGKNNLSKEKMKVIKGRSVTLYPDLGEFQNWRAIVSGMPAVKASDALEHRATKAESAAGFDIADYFLRAYNHKLSA